MTTTRFRKPLHIALPDSTLLSGSSPYQRSPLDHDEYDMQGSLNLGAESITPSPLPSPPMSRENSWLKTGDPFAIQLHQSTSSSPYSAYSAPSSAPVRTASKQRLSTSSTPSILPGGRPMKGKRESVWDRDCAICFESAVHPHRTLCCGTLFCLEHISDWMERDTHCPTCRVEMMPAPSQKNDNSEQLLSSSDELSPNEEVAHYDGAWARILRRRSSSRASTTRSTVTIETIMESEDALLLMRLALLLMMGLVYWVLLT